MRNEPSNWWEWRQFFAARSNKHLPPLETADRYCSIPDSVARSLAIFQLGESGGGAVIQQAKQSSIENIDAHYAKAMQLFVNEEHRHAEILAICVRTLGGSLIGKNWTARLFVFARRLMGLRLKVLVLLAAEVVGVCYYHLLATRLPKTRLQRLLVQIVEDERAHLHFHCSFLRSQMLNGWRRALFVLVWRTTMAAAGFVVLIDHRHVLRDLELKFSTVGRRWITYSRLAERLVLATDRSVVSDSLIRERASTAAS